MVKIDQADQGKIGNINQSSQRHSWCFTYNNYEKDDISEIVRIFRGKNITYTFQEETGEKGTKHLQGVIHCNKKLRWTELKLSNKIHWESTRNYEASVDYCSKEASRTGKVFTNVKTVIKIKILNDDVLFQWEKDIIGYLGHEPNDRVINWYWDSIGCSGKSTFAKYLYYNYDALVLSGKGSDCKYAVAAYIEHNKGVAPTLIIFDIPRCNLDYISYEAIEKIKDGLFFSSKYESKTICINSPHVIIFANEKPNVDKLSGDRWNIVKIDSRK